MSNQYGKYLMILTLFRTVLRKLYGDKLIVRCDCQIEREKKGTNGIHSNSFTIKLIKANCAHTTEISFSVWQLTGSFVHTQRESNTQNKRQHRQKNE